LALSSLQGRDDLGSPRSEKNICRT
jgi:hypothetical protein